MGRFQRVAEAFEVVAKERDCDSSGSEHSPENMADLSDLVNSFIENGDCVVDGEFDKSNHDEFDCDEIDDDMEEMKESLKRLFRFENGDDDIVRRNLVSEVEKAWRDVTGDNSSPPAPGTKRRLMAKLREQGLDAGLCKSKWDKKGRLLNGDYEYIDINVANTRYIISVSFEGEFEIARPTDSYTSVLEIFPKILVCKIEDLKEILRIMCRAIKKSMKRMKMHVPPWRRREYVQAKWFGSYKRTINEFSTKSVTDSDINSKKTVGFVSLPVRTCYRSYRENFARRDFGLKIGNLAMAMNGAS